MSPSHERLISCSLITDLDNKLLLGRSRWEESLASRLGGIESPGKRELGVDALNTVSRVDILDQGDLVAGGTSLTRDDGGIGKEEFPNLECVSCGSHNED